MEEQKRSWELEEPAHPLPYYRDYPLEWRADRRVQNMGTLARGLYRELRDEQWIKGYIPSDVSTLAVAAACPRDEMEASWPKIAPFYIEAEPGKLIEPELEMQRRKAILYCAQQAQYGKRGGRPKKSTSDPLPETAGKGLEKATLSEPKGSANGSHTEPKGSENGSQSHKDKEEEIKNKDLVPNGTSRSGERPEEFANLWNRVRGPLPKVKEFTESRRRKIKTRITQGLTLEKFEQVVRACARTPFLVGDNERGWQADFDWLVENDTNMAKVMEGKYSHGGNGAARPAGRSKTDGNLDAASAALQLMRANEERSSEASECPDADDSGSVIDGIGPSSCGKDHSAREVAAAM